MRRAKQTDYTQQEWTYMAGLTRGSDWTDKVQLAVVDCTGMRDADGPIRRMSSMHRRFSVRSIQHVRVYDFLVVHLNPAASAAQQKEK